MMTMDTNKEVYDILNNAIVEMKADGTLDSLIENFELVQIETGARAMALSSGKVDAVFWTRSVTCKECNKTFAENIEGTLVTESCFSDTIAKIELKSEK